LLSKTTAVARLSGASPKTNVPSFIDIESGTQGTCADSDSKPPSANSIRTPSACFSVIKRRLNMAVRAEDIVRNSEVSARVMAGPRARAVPRVTDALKSATFEPQCHDKPLRVDQRGSSVDTPKVGPAFAPCTPAVFHFGATAFIISDTRHLKNSRLKTRCAKHVLFR
jgi:hypothetical protein